MKETKEITQSQFVVLLSYILEKSIHPDSLISYSTNNNDSKFWLKISTILPNYPIEFHSYDLNMNSHADCTFIYKVKGLLLIAHRQKSGEVSKTMFTIEIDTEISKEYQAFIQIALARLPYMYFLDYQKDSNPIEIAICNIIYGNTRIERMEATLANLKKGIGFLQNFKR
jgi:hypothetical protein